MISPFENGLLDATPAEEHAHLSRVLARTRLPRGRLLFAEDELMDRVLFPVGAVISLTTHTSEGEVIENAMIGREGVVGAWMLLGDVALSPWSGAAHIDGDAWECSAADFMQCADELPGLRRLALRSMLVQAYFTSQSVACNRFHDLEQRMARWLLILCDRSGLDRFPVTHELLGQMLGVYRPSVTLTLHTLAEAGIVQSERRGEVRVVDLAGLRAAACECYGQVERFARRVRGEDAS